MSPSQRQTIDSGANVLFKVATFLLAAFFGIGLNAVTEMKADIKTLLLNDAAKTETVKSLRKDLDDQAAKVERLSREMLRKKRSTTEEDDPS